MINNVNTKMIEKIYSDKNFAISLYENLDLKPFDSFYNEENIEGMLINSEDALFFIAHACEHVDLVKKMWSEESYNITYELSSMSNKRIAAKLCKYAVLSKDEQKGSFMFSLKKVMSILPKEQVKSFKKEIIECFLKFSCDDVFPLLINKNLINIKDLISFSSMSDCQNETIIKILNKYKKINLEDVSYQIEKLNNDFEGEIKEGRIGENIKLKNNMISLKTLIDINQDDIVLTYNDTQTLFKIAKHFNDTQLFSLVNKMRLNKIFNKHLNHNEKIFRKKALI